MAHESQETDEKKWPSHVEHIFIEIMLEEQLKGNMPNSVFKVLHGHQLQLNLTKRSGKTLSLSKFNRSTIGFDSNNASGASC